MLSRPDAAGLGCGVQVLTYCVMGNHFHVLAAVPHRESWMARFDGPERERRLLGHLRSLYSRAYIGQLQAEFAEWRRLGMESMVQKKLESFKRRLCDLSRFVKEVKERFYPLPSLRICGLALHW